MSPLVTKNQIVNSSCSDTLPTWMRQTRLGSWSSWPIASPQSRKTIVSVAASRLLEVVPNRSWTRFAVVPSSFMYLIRRSANAFSLPFARLKNATITSAVGRAESVK